MNLDKLKRFPSQDLEQRHDECVGETWADILGNIHGIPFDPGFSYAAALRINNTTPTTMGSDPYAGGLGAIVYGALPTDKEPFDATSTSELYEANFDNYATQRSMALPFAIDGLQRLFTYEDVANYLNTGQTGVQLTLAWYESFNQPNADGTLPKPAGRFTTHSAAAYEVTPLGLRIKSWQGPNCGQDGYLFLNETVFNLCFFGASRPVLGASRWVSLITTLFSKWYLFSDIYPQLTAAQTGATLISKETNVKPMSRLEAFCTHIRDYEGQPGDANYRNNNPGNFRFHYGGYFPKYGVVRCSPDGFAIFQTYQIGWTYMLAAVTQMVENHPQRTFNDFFAAYAPSKDKNDPVAYAKHIASEMQVEPTANLKNTLNI